MKAGLPETPTIDVWLGQVLPPHSKVGVDSRLISIRKKKIELCSHLL